jgi:hypothetical protein
VKDSQTDNAKIAEFTLNLFSPIGAIIRAAKYAENKNEVRKAASKLNVAE